MVLLSKKGINLMSEINTPRDVKNALKAIDIELLDQLIRQSLREVRTYPLQPLQLYRCGSYVTRKLFVPPSAPVAMAEGVVLP